MQLNSKKMMHLDLKPENILVVSGEGNYKICDFGSSQIAQRSQISRYGSQAFGTFNYLAPENYLPYEGVRTNYSADIWSLGIILYEMIFKKLPFKLEKNGTVKIEEMEAFFSGEESVINYSKPYRTESTEKFVKALKLMLKPIPPERISWVSLRDLLV
jgi:serine/threonine protein kinase